MRILSWRRMLEWRRGGVNAVPDVLVIIIYHLIGDFHLGVPAKEYCRSGSAARAAPDNIIGG
jgi:hypothetical protein